MKLYNTTANEPQVHPLISKRSFVFLPSAGMRLAPEILVLELMREVFFKHHYGNPIQTKELRPDEFNEEGNNIFTINEQAVLYALRGRRKKSIRSNSPPVFAPAYPQLAQHGWLGKNRERVINNFLLSGPFVQHLWFKGETSAVGLKKQGELINSICNALIGSKSDLATGNLDKEILAVTLGNQSFSQISKELAIENLKSKTSINDWEPMSGLEDELAYRITTDFEAICTLESALPRMQWIYVLMTYLRFALPMWLLSQMQITILLHNWLINAITKDEIPSYEKILSALKKRNRSLLHPTLTPTRELFEHIEVYMKCRVEVNIILYLLENVIDTPLQKKKLSVSSEGTNYINLEKLLIIASNAKNEINSSEFFRKYAAQDLNSFLIREGEQHAAWRNPLLKGQGKNIDEFFRVLYKAEIGDESGGFLLMPEGRGIKRGFRVFPGQLLLKTITYLASQEKRKYHTFSGSGKLILQDVESLFAEYGIDFSTAADARPLLMNELQAMGLLVGSPDAGSSVTVFCPF